MNKYVLILIMAVSSFSAIAQSGTNIVLHLQTADTLVYKSVVNQVSNLKKAFPDSRVEVVCHGPGLDFLKKGSRYATKVDKLKLSNVELVGCEFTMSQKNIRKEDLVPFADTVPFGIAELVKKQQDGWLYVKLGF